MKEVVLAPGLWNPGAAMAFLAARLAASGFKPHVFAYRGRSPFEGNVASLANFLHERFDGHPVHVVGHSLGGVLVFETLSRHPEISVGSVVLLGAPVRGCLTGRRFGDARLGRWMLGACRDLWHERGATWQRSEPLGVIAGTIPMGLGRALGRLPGPNDGVVCVEETTIEGMSGRALMPQGHSMLILSGRVAKAVARFLESGGFE